jgi:hypothetical protein
MTQHGPEEAQRENTEHFERWEESREDSCSMEKAIVRLFSACRLLIRKDLQVLRASLPGMSRSFDEAKQNKSSIINHVRRATSYYLPPTMALIFCSRRGTFWLVC